MALEALTGSSVYINALNNANPVGGTDSRRQGDDHIRGIKNVLLNSFPNITGAVNAAQAELNALVGITSNVSELNILDGATVTAAELNELDRSANAVANYQQLIQRHQYNAATSPTELLVHSQLTRAAWETIGPTGSGADYEWSVLDVVPTEAQMIRLSINCSINMQATGLAFINVHSRPNGSSWTTTAADTVTASGYAQAIGNTFYGAGNLFIPLDANNIFEMRWAEVGAGGTHVNFVRAHLKEFFE